MGKAASRLGEIRSNGDFGHCVGRTKIRSIQNLSCSVKFDNIQYIPRNMHTVFALLCFVVVIHWLIFPYPSGLLHWHCGNLTIAPVPAKQPRLIWINTSCELIMNDCVTTTKQSTTKPCAYFLGYTVFAWMAWTLIIHHSVAHHNAIATLVPVVRYRLCSFNVVIVQMWGPFWLMV